MISSPYSLPYSMAEITATVPDRGTVSERSKKHYLYLIFIFFFSDHFSSERSGTASADV